MLKFNDIKHQFIKNNSKHISVASVCAVGGTARCQVHLFFIVFQLIPIFHLFAAE